MVLEFWIACCLNKIVGKMLLSLPSLAKERHSVYEMIVCEALVQWKKIPRE